MESNSQESYILVKAAELQWQNRRQLVKLHIYTQSIKLYQRLFVEASGSHPNSIGGIKYWFQAVDDQSCYSPCTFVKKKIEMVEFI
jgi:hypothetical protein